MRYIGGRQMQQYCNKERFVRRALHRLQDAGYRITRSRRLVLEALGGRREPASPYELRKELQGQGQRLDAVTIYRILELLERMNLAHKILSKGGYVRCTLESDKGCHGHLVCRNCGGLQEFADESLCHREDEVAAQHGFLAERHMSEFSGLCAGCRK